MPSASPRTPSSAWPHPRRRRRSGCRSPPLPRRPGYGSGPILILTAIPMLIIANAYRRCNMWNANCGASFEWVGRAISPYLGFLAGWLMVVGLHHRHGGGDPAARPVGTGGLRLHVHQHLGAGSAIGTAVGRGHADHRGRRHPHHGPRPGRHGAGGVPDPHRAGDRRPALRARPPPRLVPRSPRAGSASTASAGRAALSPAS